MARLCEPEHIVWIDGSDEEKERLIEEAEATGEVRRLNPKKLPGCLYHRTAVNDVANTATPRMMMETVNNFDSAVCGVMSP